MSNNGLATGDYQAQGAVESEEFHRDGFTTIRGVLGPGEVETFRSCLPENPDRAGARNLFRNSPLVAAAIHSTGLKNVLRTVAGSRDWFAVRGILFDKTPAANWHVSWHQDLTIAVKVKRAVPSFGPWSTKENVTHVQPPSFVLRGMVTVRIYLDDCDESNGALRVIPGSHREGRLDGRAIEAWKAHGPIITCCGKAGDALFLRPLILHSSPKAASPSRRRILHVEYACEDLPGGLLWFDRVLA